MILKVRVISYILTIENHTESTVVSQNWVFFQNPGLSFLDALLHFETPCVSSFDDFHILSLFVFHCSGKIFLFLFFQTMIPELFGLKFVGISINSSIVVCFMAFFYISEPKFKFTPTHFCIQIRIAWNLCTIYYSLYPSE